MKRTLLLFAASIFILSANAQTITYEEVSNATKRPRGSFDEYITSLSESIKVGDTMYLGSPSNANNSFLYVSEAAFASTPTLANITAQGWGSEVLKITTTGTKRMGFSVIITSKTELGLTRYYTQYEKALTVNEVATEMLTREKAIAKLKEAKELFDLDMMTKLEYEAVRTKVTPIIKGSN
jgi:hypothetical protein